MPLSDDVLSQFGPAAAVRVHTLGEEYQPPATLVADLTAPQALAVPPGSPYSIADVLAHVVFWQETWLATIEERATPDTGKRQNADWPDVTADEWSPLFEQFLNGLERAWSLADQSEAELSRVLDDGKTVGQLLLHLVQHNNYHFGQIALLRQMQNLWPPAGSDDTWEEPLHA